MRLMRCAITEAGLRQPRLDDMENMFATSIDLLFAFSIEYPNEWRSFLSAIPLSLDDANHAIEQEFKNVEQRAVRSFEAPTGSGLTAEQAKTLSEFQSPNSQVVHDAMRSVIKSAKDANEVANPGRLIQMLLTEDSAARRMLLGFAPVEQVEAAFPSLYVESMDIGPAMSLEFVREHSRKLAKRIWPKIQEEVEALTSDYVDRKEELFEKNPERYATRRNLVDEWSRPLAYPEYEFGLMSQACVSAAEVEARIRKAPEFSLDHLFFSLLQDGTATVEFLESKGIDWRVWRAEMDLALPTFGEGPRWPKKSSDLGLHGPEEKIRPKSPDLRTFLDSNRIEEWKTAMEANMAMARPRKFSDLLWLISCFEEPETLAYGYLTGAGITVEEVKAQTDSVY